MNKHKTMRVVRNFSAILAGAGLVATMVSADLSGAVETTLHSFNTADGNQPSAALVQASDGNFYGTTMSGGTIAVGTVFQITPTGSLITLHSFAGNTEGSYPTGSLVENSLDTFYGTTRNGGGFNSGTLFQIAPSGTLKTLYAFSGGNDGSHPMAGLIPASDGNYYGTTADNGTAGAGTLFQLAPSGSTLKTLYNFAGGVDGNSDGAYPETGLIQASDGNFYGTSFAGGTGNCGTVFELTLPTSTAPNGVYSTLYNFTCDIGLIAGGVKDQGAPLAGLVQGPAGSDGTLYLYGTTSGNGLDGSGTIFQIAISGASAGTLTTLHTFSGAADGGSPAGNLLLGSDGNLYGTTSIGGANGDGTVYWLHPDGSNFTTLYTFGGTDGAGSIAGLVQGSDGNLYGVTAVGGAGSGTVFQLMTQPPLAAPVSMALAPSTIYLGQSSTLTWSILNSFGGSSAQCFANGSWSGAQAPSGTQSFTPAAIGSFTYTLTCGGGQSASATLTVNSLDNPTGVSPVFGDGSVDLSWTPVQNEGVTGYEVVEGSCNNISSPVATTANSNVNVTTSTGGAPLQDGTTYFFKVLSTNSAGTSNCANAPLVHVTPMALPTGLTATPGDSQGTVTWNLALGAATYQLYSVNGTVVTPVTQNIACSNTTTTGSCTITGLTDGTTYTYTVASLNPNSGIPETGFALNNVSFTPVATPAGAPTNLTGQAGDQQVTLTFSSVAGAASYRVYESTASSGGFLKVTTGLTFTSSPDGSTITAVVTGLTDGTAYQFLVSALNSVNAEGPKAGPVGLTPQALPGTPVNLKATPLDSEVDLTWSPANGAVTYNLYQGTAAGGETLLQANIQSTSYHSLSLTNGTTYYYKVAAVNPTGVSALSQEVSAMPVATPTDAPANLIATPGNQQITLDFSPVTGAASYKVYESAAGSAFVKVTTGLSFSSSPDGSVLATITGLSNGTTYSFLVSALNSINAEGPKAGPVSAVPLAPSGAPANVIATPGDGNVSLTWSTVAGATSYNLYQATTSGAEVLVQSNIQTNSAHVLGLTDGTTYYFKVASVNPTGVGPLSQEVSTTPELTPTGTPANLLAAPGDKQITLSFSTVTGASSYNVYQATAASGSFAKVTSGLSFSTSTDGTTVFALVTGLTDGTSYQYLVSAVNSINAEGPKAGPVSAVPQALSAPPANVSATPGDGNVSLTWSTIGTATSYNLYQGTATGAEVLVQTNIQTTSAHVLSLTNGATYYFKVASVNPTGVGALSQEVNATPEATPTGAPANLIAAPGDKQITLSFSPVTGAASYNIYEETPASGTFTKVTSGLSFTTSSDGATVYVVVSALTDGTSYSFLVSAVNSIAAEGPKAGPASAVPQALAAPPASVAATPGDGLITVSWSAVSGASSYNLYQGTAAGGEVLVQTNIQANSYHVLGLTNGTTYYFKVASVNPTGVGTLSQEVSSMPVATPVGAPANLTAQPGDTVVTLSFSTVANASTYKIYESNSTMGTFINVTTGLTFSTSADGSTEFVVVSGLTDGTPYYFLVSAVNSIGAEDSSRAGPVGATPQALPTTPLNFAAVAKDGEIDLSWGPVTGASSYNVYQGTTSGSEVLVQSNIQSPSYRVLGLTDGTTYYFQVASVNPTGVSAPSLEVSGVPTLAPPPPTNFKAKGGNQEVTLTWTASPSALSYTIYEQTGSSGPVLIAQNITGTSYPVTGLTNTLFYGFSISAVNGAGSSDPTKATAGATPEQGKGSSNGAFEPEILAVLAAAVGLRRRRGRRQPA